jgi:hypothetical protein
VRGRLSNTIGLVVRSRRRSRSSIAGTGLLASRRGVEGLEGARGWLVENLANSGGGAARPRRPARRFYFCRQSAKWARHPGQNPPPPSSPLIGARRRSCSRRLLTGRCSAGCCKGGVWRCRDSRPTARPANRGRSRWRQVKNSSHSLSCRTLCVGHSAVDLHQHDAGH